MMSFAKIAVIVLVAYVCFSLVRRLRPAKPEHPTIDEKTPSQGDLEPQETLEKCPKCGVYHVAEKGNTCPNCQDTTRQKS